MSFHLLSKWLILTVQLLSNVLVHFQPHVFRIFCGRQATVFVCFEFQGTEVLLVVRVVHAVLWIEAMHVEEGVAGEEPGVGGVEILRWGGSRRNGALEAVEIFFLGFI